MTEKADRVGTLENRPAYAWLALALGTVLEALKQNPRDKTLRTMAGVLLSDPAQEFGKQGTVCTSKALMAKDFIKKMGYAEEIVFKAVFFTSKQECILGIRGKHGSGEIDRPPEIKIG